MLVFWVSAGPGCGLGHPLSLSVHVHGRRCGRHSGLFFEVFYRQLANQKTKSTPFVERASTALVRPRNYSNAPRLAMRFRGSPSYWAAYALISKE